MAFMEQISKKLTDMSQNVSQQAKNFADVTRINGVIDEKKRRIPQIYITIGQAYYERHRNDDDAEELDSIKEINTLFAEIAQYEEEIKQIKGGAKCPKCGADIPNGAAFCSSCGAQIPKPESKPSQQDNSPHCPRCGCVIKSGNLFCNYCGEKLDISDSAPEIVESVCETVETETVESSAHDKSDKITAEERHCPECGAVIKPGNAFCNTCGAKVDEN